MAKVSPIKLNFNAGEFAVTVEGRVDLDRHPASMRQMKNAIAAPQGPCIRRSGTLFEGRVFDHAKHSGLISFVFSDEQSQILEFCDERVRYVSEDGFQVFTPVSITSVVTASPFKFTSAALVAAGVAQDDELILDGFAANLNVNGQITKVTAVSGNDVTVDLTYTGATGAQADKTAAKLYHIVSPYDEADVRNVVAVQNIDVLYLFCPGYRTRVLSRYGPYDWRLETMAFTDGPFEPEDPNYPTLTPDVTGRATGIHTSNTSETPSTGTVSSSGDAAGSVAAWMAFDGNKETYWQAANAQSGELRYEFAAGTVIEGYTIYMAKRNVNTVNDDAAAFAPSTWAWKGRFAAGDWVTLDERFDYPSYKNYRSQHIKYNNKIAYDHYMIDIENVGASGGWNPRIAGLFLRKAGDVFINLTASGTTRINKDQGFLSTDVGRLLRLYQNDGFWRSVEITAVTDTTHIQVKLQGEPLYDIEPVRRWRIGTFSDTTGWPTTGTFFNDRLAVGGVQEYPTMVGLSAVGQHDVFSPTDPDGTVIDDNGMNIKLNSRKASPIRWLVGDKAGLLIGTGDSEWIVKEANTNSSFSARNVKADEQTARGSAAIQPVKIDRQVIFAQSSRRTIREYAYDFQSDGFKSPSMSLFAPHLGVPAFAQMVYAAEPHSIIWHRRDDGSIAGLTYQRDEGVVGWHRHDFGGVVESTAVAPSFTGGQDTLWMVVRRTIDGQTRRYIERLYRFWDFDSTLETAHYADCGLMFNLSAPQQTFYGNTHLEGEAICGVADGVPFGTNEEVIVTDGAFTLPFEAEEYITYGLPFEMLAETQRPNDGAADGTAQGKTARTNQVVPFLWQSAGGEIGVHNEDQKQDEFMAFEYPYMAAEELFGAVQLTTGMLDIHTLPPGYSVRKTLLFRQVQPLPLNVIALMPQMTVQDR